MMKSTAYIILLIGTILFSTLANCRTTDAMILSTKSTSGGISQTNILDTGITIENGDVWVWGFRNSGQQGNGVRGVSPASTPPARVSYFVQNNINIVQITAGAYHIIALDEHGDVWGWGQNGYDEAGAGVCTAGYVSSPCRILKGKNIVTIGAGEYFSLALSASGNVYSWGLNTSGQVGDGTGKSHKPLYQIPRSKFNGESVVLLGVAYQGGYAITESGDVYAWGDDEDNAFGNGNGNGRTKISSPVLMRNLAVDGGDISYICGGQPFTNYLSSSGEVYGMGGNFTLGINQCSGNTNGPALITGRYNISKMYCRYSGSIAITDDDKLLTWGFCSSAFGIYGKVPTERTYYGNITKIDGGKEHFYYWTDTGKVYGVGYGAGRKFSQTSNSNVVFPGVELTFLLNAMKAVYGKDYVPGQGL